jgi:hypothetical protein
MKLLHSIGISKHSNYNTREELQAFVLTGNEGVSFDGVYLNVWENRDIIPEGSILFVVGDTVGKDNSFDRHNVPKLERFCDWNQIMDLVTERGCELGWHTWSHRDLTNIDPVEILEEITPPFPMRYFAYPYGNYNSRIVDKVINAGYDKAYSVTQGKGNHQFTLPRSYLWKESK